MILDELEGSVIHLAVLGDLAKRSTGDGECLFLGIDLLEATDLFDRSLVQGITAVGVARGCGVDEDRPIPQFVHQEGQLPVVRGIWVYLREHSGSMYLVEYDAWGSSR